MILFKQILINDLYIIVYPSRHKLTSAHLHISYETFEQVIIQADHSGDLLQGGGIVITKPLGYRKSRLHIEGSDVFGPKCIMSYFPDYLAKLLVRDEDFSGFGQLHFHMAFKFLCKKIRIPGRGPEYILYSGEVHE